MKVPQLTVLLGTLLICILFMCVLFLILSRETFDADGGGHHRLPRLSLEELDQIPYIDEHGNAIDHLSQERQEQEHANKYIAADAVVLELGARYGTVSCIINNILDDPFGHVVIEPDNTVLHALVKNRNSHNAYFTVYNAIISEESQTLMEQGYGSFVQQGTRDTWAPRLPSVSVEHIMDRHGIRFNTLVADCEGCLEKFFDENLDFVASLRLIMFEKDQGHMCDYAKIEASLEAMGFDPIEPGFHSVWQMQKK